MLAQLRVKDDMLKGCSESTSRIKENIGIIETSARGYQMEYKRYKANLLNLTVYNAFYYVFIL